MVEDVDAMYPPKILTFSALYPKLVGDLNYPGILCFEVLILDAIAAS